MRLYLLRHGIAETGKPGSPDSERALTAEGRRKLRDVLALAEQAGVKPTLIVSSPYKRAFETASLAAKVLGYEGEIARSEALTPDRAAEEAWGEIRLHKAEESLLLTGHEPLFSHLLSYLLGAGRVIADFKKGALARIDIDTFGPQPRGVLRWFFPPRLAE